MTNKHLIGVASAALLAGCASMMYTPPTAQETEAVIKDGFRERGMAKLDRLDQSELQAACSQATMTHTELPKAERARLEKAALDAIKYPSDGKYLGDWKAGEKVAQAGRGLQFSDNEKTVNGGNCYACHQLDKAEISYGNIGPSLYNYGKLRGNSEQIVKYTWAKIWNTNAYNVCSSMPPFGASNILSEQQIKDVMALLLDPNSPVNK